jgi:urea transporter
MHSYAAPIKRTFLGFPRAGCPECGAENLQPLTSGYRTIYIVACLFCAVLMVVGLSQGSLFAPSWLVIGGIIALVKDHGLRAREAVRYGR